MSKIALVIGAISMAICGNILNAESFYAGAIVLLWIAIATTPRKD